MIDYNNREYKCYIKCDTFPRLYTIENDNGEYYSHYYQKYDKASFDMSQWLLLVTPPEGSSILTAIVHKDSYHRKGPY